MSPPEAGTTNIPANNLYSSEQSPSSMVYPWDDCIDGSSDSEEPTAEQFPSPTPRPPPQDIVDNDIIMDDVNRSSQIEVLAFVCC